MDNDNFFVSFYITHPDYRRRRIGASVWKASISSLMDQGKNIMLYAVEGKANMYRTIGLKQAAFKCVGCRSTLDVKNKTVIDNKYVEVVPIKSVPFDAILTYDKTVQDMPRKTVLEYLLKDAVSGFVALRNDIVVGYGCARTVTHGYRLGPVYADNEDIARSLIVRILVELPADTLIESNLYVNNTPAMALIDSLGLFDSQNFYQKSIMYSKYLIPFRLDKVYCIIDFDTSVC